MRTGIIALICLLSAMPSTLAIYGGETLSYFFPTCDKYNVTISPCEPNEWNISSCNENNTGFWMCDCSDNYSVNLTSAANSLGNFTIKIDYMWTTLTDTQESVQYQYGGGCVPEWECKTWSNCLENGTQNRECNDVKGCSYKNKIIEWRDCVYTAPVVKPVEKPVVNDTKINDTINDTSPEPKEDGFNYLILEIMGGIALIGAIAFFLYRYFRNKPTVIETIESLAEEPKEEDNENNTFPK